MNPQSHLAVVGYSAALVTACHARDKDDLADLLGALGLLGGEDDLVRRLPHISSPDDPTTGDTMPTDAFTATAVSVIRNGDNPEHVRSTLGLSETELTDAMQHADQPIPATGTDLSQAPGAEPDNRAADSDGIETLLAWAENHPAASIRNRAARVRTDLTELTERRATDAAQRDAEERVAKAKAELEAAQARLREVKAGGRTATASPASNTPAPTPIGKRTKEQLAAIRTWARANGYSVADRGTPAKTVLDAYDAAHRTTHLSEAS